MGLTYYDARRLWEAHLAGVSFENTVTFGRLHLFLHPTELETLRRDYRTRFPGSKITPLENYSFGEYSDRFWTEFLEASRVETLDYSDYEGATVIHDMNTAVPEHLRERFDAVIEAGSLEHVFQFPVAIQNLMRMAKTGGMVFLTTVANNLCGHGFYQFSPELMYRIFSPENGFDAPRVVLLEGTYPWMELTPLRAAYEVTDPARVGERVGLQSVHPVMMMVDAKKISDVAPFVSAPQQSDYTAAWDAAAGARESSGEGSSPHGSRQFLKRIFRALPMAWQRRILGHRSKRQFSFSNSRFYRRLR